MITTLLVLALILTSVTLTHIHNFSLVMDGVYHDRMQMVQNTGPAFTAVSISPAKPSDHDRGMLMSF